MNFDSFRAPVMAALITTLFALAPSPCVMGDEPQHAQPEDENASDDDNEPSIFDRMFPPQDARYRPRGRRPFPEDFDWRKGGDGRYRLDPRRVNNLANETFIQIRVCVGETATVPLDGTTDDNSLLPAEPDIDGVGGSLRRNGGQLVLTITPGKEGTHTGTLKNSDGGKVFGLHIEVIAIDCAKPSVAGEPPDIGATAGPAEPAPGSEAEKPQPPSGLSGLGAPAGGADERPAPEPEDDQPKPGAADAAADAAKRAVEKVAGTDADDENEDGIGASLRDGARRAAGELTSGAPGGEKGSLADQARAGTQRIPLGAWSEGVRGRLPAGTKIVTFRTEDENGNDPDIGGTTRINLAALGVSEETRDQVVVNFIATDNSISTHSESGSKVGIAANSDLVVDVPPERKFGGLLIQAGDTLIAILADAPRRPPGPAAIADNSVGIADGELEIAQGELSGETLVGPADMADPAFPVSDHGVAIGENSATPVAVRSGEIAIIGEGIEVPPDGEMEIGVTAPSGERYTGDADAWSYQVTVPEVTQRKTPVDVSLKLNGIEANEDVTVTFYPQEGQEISPSSVRLNGVENGAPRTIASLKTEKLGYQAFSVKVTKAVREADSSN